jgi:hypothetical protein
VEYAIPAATSKQLCRITAAIIEQEGGPVALELNISSSFFVLHQRIFGGFGVADQVQPSPSGSTPVGGMDGRDCEPIFINGYLRLDCVLRQPLGCSV